MVDRAGEHSEGWVHQVSDQASGALRSARDRGGAMLNRVGSYAGAGGVSDAFERNPLIMGAIGVMAGALIAALVPLSEVENELLGETRDELWQRAEDLGEEAVQRVREAATEAATRAVDAATGAADRQRQAAWGQIVRSLTSKPDARLELAPRLIYPEACPPCRRHPMQRGTRRAGRTCFGVHRGARYEVSYARRGDANVRRHRVVVCRHYACKRAGARPRFVPRGRGHRGVPVFAAGHPRA